MTDNQQPKLSVVMGTGAAGMRLLGGNVDASVTFPVAASPVLTGPHGKAWLCDTAVGIKQLGYRPEDDACLAHWVVEAPWAHPAWHSYSVLLVHLRPMPGKDTMFYLDGATHELWVYAIDPNKDRSPIIATGIIGAAWLQPKNFAAQFIEISDELARERVKRAVQDICDGKLSPDTDFIRAWAALFGDNMLKDCPNARQPMKRRG